MSPEWQFLLDTVVRWLPYIAVIIMIPILVMISRCLFKGSCKNGPVQKLDSQADVEVFNWMESGKRNTGIRTEISKSLKTNQSYRHKSLPNLPDSTSDDIFKSISLTRDPSGIATVNSRDQMTEITTAPKIDPGVCSLCHQVYTDENVIKNLPCSHHFHQECAEDWFSKRGYCPKCIQPSSASVVNA